MSDSFGLFLFATEPGLLRDAVVAGVDGVVVDWERRGKHARQDGLDTEINEHTVDDLVRVRSLAPRRVVCRLNPLSDESAAELEAALAGGADEVLLPMVQSSAEVEALLELAAGRCGVGILVETVSAVRAASELAGLPLSRAYVGLNDLAIERRSTSIFDAVRDGTVERVRREFEVPFGFGGLTVPDRGAPVPCRYLIAEMARLDCSFAFLRRSFRRDIADRDVGESLGRIRAAVEAAAARSPRAVAEDRGALVRLLEGGRAELGLEAEAAVGG
jgi:hypothetical protein